MTYMAEEIDPILLTWLHEQFGAAALRASGNPLTALTLLATRQNSPEFPRSVIAAWSRLVISQQRLVDQSELALLEEVMRQGMSTHEIALLFKLSDENKVQARHAELVEKIR